jgi:putative transcriptional regulator
VNTSVMWSEAISIIRMLPGPKAASSSSMCSDSAGQFRPFLITFSSRSAMLRPRPATTARAARRRISPREIIEGLRELEASLKNKAPLEQVFTVRTVELDLRPRDHDGESVRSTRRSLGASQAVFARLMGVSVATVEAWEQGMRKVNLTARRLLDEINRDPKHWIKMLRDSARLKRPA